MDDGSLNLFVVIGPIVREDTQILKDIDLAIFILALYRPNTRMTQRSFVC